MLEGFALLTRGEIVVRNVYVVLAFFLTAAALVLVLSSHSSRVDAYSTLEAGNVAYTDVLCTDSVASEVVNITQIGASSVDAYLFALLEHSEGYTGVEPSNANCPKGTTQRCRWIYIGGSSGSQWIKVCSCK